MFWSGTSSFPLLLIGLTVWALYRGAAATTTTGAVPGGSISYTCITKIFFILKHLKFNNSLVLLNLLHFLKCALTLSIFLLIRAVQCLHMTFNLSLSISSTCAHSAAHFLPLPKGILNTKFYCYVSKNW